MNSATAVPIDDSEEKRPIGQLSFDTKQLYLRLKKMAVSEVVKYEELNAIIGRDVQKDARSNLMAARRKVLHQDGIVIGVIMDVGVKYLSDEEIIKSGAATIKHLHRSSVRGMRQQVQVDFTKLDGAQKQEYNATLSTLQIARLMTGSRGQAKIAGAVEKQQARLDSGKMLELFGTTGRAKP